MNLAADDLAELESIAPRHGKPVPHREAIEVRGIVRVADVVDMVKESASPWFEGPFGRVLTNVCALLLLPFKGRLSLFAIDAPADWRRKAGL